MILYTLCDAYICFMGVKVLIATTARLHNIRVLFVSGKNNIYPAFKLNTPIDFHGPTRDQKQVVFQRLKWHRKLLFRCRHD